MSKKESAKPASVEQVAAQAVADGSAHLLFESLAKALTQAIQTAKGPEKKTFANRKPGDPWAPKDGSKKLKLKRKMYQHGIPIDPDFHTNEEIDLLNKLKTGRYLRDWVKVYKRKDQGIDIDYPIRTASQRMKLVGEYGVRDFKDLLMKCIEESKHPKVELPTEDDDE